METNRPVRISCVMDDRLLPPDRPLGLQLLGGGEDAASPSPPPRLDPSLGAVNALLMQTAVPFSSKIRSVDDRQRRPQAAAMSMSSSTAKDTHYGLEGHGALYPPSASPQGEMDGGHERRRRKRRPLLTSPPLRRKCS